MHLCSDMEDQPDIGYCQAQRRFIQLARVGVPNDSCVSDIDI